ncbi:unnamed protein product [Phytophthora fragariaefolia]|uniref:Unnamed protein product n=1 Tax=Phytophthora fragariaefolia TaxID=1490495 RepID=A0A9W7CNV1_9STRA|nr:unnamed protein product [Phytophthora fragariaefolia]
MSSFRTSQPKPGNLTFYQFSIYLVEFKTTQHFGSIQTSKPGTPSANRTPPTMRRCTEKDDKERYPTYSITVRAAVKAKEIIKEVVTLKHWNADEKFLNANILLEGDLLEVFEDAAFTDDDTRMDDEFTHALCKASIVEPTIARRSKRSFGRCASPAPRHSQTIRPRRPWWSQRQQQQLQQQVLPLPSHEHAQHARLPGTSPREMVPNKAALTARLNRLSSKKVTFMWTTKDAATSQEIKAALACNAWHAFPDYSRAFYVFADASGHELFAVEDEDVALDWSVIKKHQRNDSSCKNIISQLGRNESDPEYTLRHAPGVVPLHYRKRVVVPESLRINLVELYHEYLVHPGAEKQFRSMATFWWPGMDGDMANFVKKCVDCTKAKLHGKKQQ